MTTVVKTTFGPPGTAEAGPVLTIERSAEADAVPDVELVLLPGVGSFVVVATVAVFVSTVPMGTEAGSFTTRVKTAGTDGAKDASVHEIVPPAPTAGVPHDQPPGEVSDTKVVTPGRGSVRLAETAVDGPAFVTVIV